MIAFPQLDTCPMNMPHRQCRNALAIGVWALWIDSVGGFRLLEGDRFTVGGLGGDDPADIAVRSSWRTRMATLSRSGDGFWWSPHLPSSPDSAAPSDPLPTHPLMSGEVIFPGAQDAVPGSGLPHLRFHQPSPLSKTAVLTLDPPYRFVAPVDGILLFDKTILIGPDPTNHIRVSRMTESLIMIKRGNEWTIRQQDSSTRSMVDGQSVDIGDLVMTIRRESLAEEVGEKK
jgi:hypothetical protein